MKILYGVCGEGRGHAGRSFALAQRLLSLGHQIDVFTFDQGYDLFLLSGFPEKNLHRIPGLGFKETERGISPTGTIGNYLKSYKPRKETIKKIIGLYSSDKPDLVITDFEPLLAKVARKLDVPLITVDNQHKFLTPLKEGFGYTSNLHNALLGVFVKWFIGKADHHIITTFHKCRHLKGITRVDTMLRDEFANQTPVSGDHILVYLHHSVANKVLPILKDIKEKFLVYGVTGASSDNIEFKKTSYEEFVKDLATCKAVICSAGNQLLGESKYFGKKVLAIPIPKQEEQILNSKYIELENMGVACNARKLTLKIIEDFLATDFPTQTISNGVDEVVEFIISHYGENQS